MTIPGVRHRPPGTGSSAGRRRRGAMAERDAPTRPAVLAAEPGAAAGPADRRGPLRVPAGAVLRPRVRPGGGRAGHRAARRRHAAGRAEVRRAVHHRVVGMGQRDAVRQPVRPRRRRLPAVQAGQHGRRRRPRGVGDRGDGGALRDLRRLPAGPAAAAAAAVPPGVPARAEARPVVRLYLSAPAAGALLWAVSLLVPRPVGVRGVGARPSWSRRSSRCWSPRASSPTSRCTSSTCPSGSRSS